MTHQKAPRGIIGSTRLRFSFKKCKSHTVVDSWFSRFPLQAAERALTTQATSEEATVDQRSLRFAGAEFSLAPPFNRPMVLPAVLLALPLFEQPLR